MNNKPSISIDVNKQIAEKQKFKHVNSSNVVIKGLEDYKGIFEIDHKKEYSIASSSNTSNLDAIYKAPHSVKTKKNITNIKQNKSIPKNKQKKTNIFKRFVCEKCGMRFISNYKLTGHLNKQKKCDAPKEDFKCHNCNYVFATKFGLNKHLAILAKKTAEKIINNGNKNKTIVDNKTIKNKTINNKTIDNRVINNTIIHNYNSAPKVLKCVKKTHDVNNSDPSSSDPSNSDESSSDDDCQPKKKYITKKIYGSDESSSEDELPKKKYNKKNTVTTPKKKYNSDETSTDED